ncbi:MAG: ArsR family transcriptional regulator [Pirellulaceae bacterium]|jgi:ArsR family transcriptional regulator
MATSLLTQSVIETHTPLESHAVESHAVESRTGESHAVESRTGESRTGESRPSVELKAAVANTLENDDSQEDLVQVFKLLSSGPRLQILAHLVREGELNVTDLCHRIHQTQPAVSHHLALLRLNKLLVLRRDGKHSFYSVNPARLQGVLQNLADIVLGQNADELEMSDFRLTRVG